jgi:malate permease and related proteins
MTQSALTTTILIFTGIVVVGALLRWAKVLKREDAHPINAVIIYAGLPALIFRSVHGAELRADLLGVVVVAWIVFAAMLALSWGASRLLRLPRPLAGGFILVTALGNTGFIGYPVTQALLGPTRLPEAIFYDVFGTVVAFVLVGLLVAQRMGEHDETAVNPLKELVTFPAFVALILALLLRPVAIPVPVSTGLELLGNMVAPLIMLSVGLSLRARTMGQAALPLAVVVGLRLLVAPAIAMLVGSAVLGGGDALRVAVLEAGMPAMMLSLVAGERFGLDTDFIASAIFLTTALSAVALPLVQVVAFG